VTGPIVLASFRDTAAQHGIPASTLTDNAMVYATRYSGGRGGRNAFEAQLRRLAVVQKNSRPNHPTTCGKIERSQQILKGWLAAQPVQPATLPELQTLLDAFVEAYNHRRPHRSRPHRAPPPPELARHDTRASSGCQRPYSDRMAMVPGFVATEQRRGVGPGTRSSRSVIKPGVVDVRVDSRRTLEDAAIVDDSGLQADAHPAGTPDQSDQMVSKYSQSSMRAALVF
jgi:Integrase core domain